MKICENFRLRKIRKFIFELNFKILNSKKSAQLFESTYYGEKEPLLVDFDGHTQEKFQFRFGTNTEVYGSCPVVFQGQHFIFGGSMNKRQVNALEIYR